MIHLDNYDYNFEQCSLLPGTKVFLSNLTRVEQFEPKQEQQQNAARDSRNSNNLKIGNHASINDGISELVLYKAQRAIAIGTANLLDASDCEEKNNITRDGDHEIGNDTTNETKNDNENSNICNLYNQNWTLLLSKLIEFDSNGNGLNIYNHATCIYDSILFKIATIYLWYYCKY